MSATCVVPEPSQNASFVAAGPASLGRKPLTAFLRRNGSQLLLDGSPVRLAGPNIYWLGVDENVDPSPSIPSQGRVLEVLATAAAMGANAVRATTLGVSLGCPVCVEPSLGVFNATALAAIDFAVHAASLYGLRLIIPLTDQYDYYHGGIATRLRWRNLSASDHSPFYDVTSPIYADHVRYLRALFDRNSTVTGQSLAAEPALAVLETGNELGGWGAGPSSWPPTAWTQAIAREIKAILPDALVLDGSYGVNAAALSIPEIDAASNHFYPLYAGRARADARQVAAAGKLYIAGEIDWTGKVNRLLLLVAIAPALLALATLFLPRRWFPLVVRVPRPRRPRRRTSTYIDVPSTPSADVPPALPLERATSRPPPWLIRIRKWHLALAEVVVLVPIIILAVWYSGPSPSTLDTFLSAVEQSPVSGSFYWSLFGRLSSCCDFVQHNDGYTLHYPGDDDRMRSAALALTQHAYRMSGQSPAFASSIDAISAASLPVIACPQPSLAPNR